MRDGASRGYAGGAAGHGQAAGIAGVKLDPDAWAALGLEEGSGVDWRGPWDAQGDGQPPGAGEAVRSLLDSIEHRVFNLAVDPRGCRVVQRALEIIEDRDQQKVARELAGHVREAIESPHANHVLQRCVELMRPNSVRFILDELVPSAFARPALVAKHRYGCRILERLIEHFPPSALDKFVDSLLDEAQDLSRDPYGNFVIQHVLEHGEQIHRQRVISALQADIFGNATNPHACSVLDKALSYGDPEGQRELARTMIAEPARNGRSLLVAMAAEHAGFAATQRLFKVVSGDDEHEAKRQITAGQPEIGSTKHGKALLQNLKDVLPPDRGSDYRLTQSVPTPQRRRSAPGAAGGRRPSGQAAAGITAASEEGTAGAGGGGASAAAGGGGGRFRGGRGPGYQGGGRVRGPRTQLRQL